MLKALRNAIVALLFLQLLAQPVWGTQVRNVCLLKGSEQSVISGIGVVVGLNGTGDGQFGPGHEAVLAAVSRNLSATATPADLRDADSIALVHVRAVVPAEGVRAGVDQLDVTVATINDAQSLKGGVLLDAVLFGPGTNGRAYAVASGNVVLEDEEENPRRATVVRGAQVVRDVPIVNLDKNNRLTFVLDQSKASWELANFIAETVNGVMVLSIDADPIAFAVDPKNVIVNVPKEALPNLSSFITQIMTTAVDPEIAAGGAKVYINRAAGTIVLSGDVELSPTIISHKGMTIQIVTPEPEPDPINPRVEVQDFALVDPDDRANPGLRQLLDALNTLNVPAEDRISILTSLHAAGALHAELIYK